MLYIFTVCEESLLEIALMWSVVFRDMAMDGKKGSSPIKAFDGLSLYIINSARRQAMSFMRRLLHLRLSSNCQHCRPRLP